jgi:hypothetical protein
MNEPEEVEEPTENAMATGQPFDSVLDLVMDSHAKHIQELESRIEHLESEREKMIRVLRVYHYDGREHGGKQDYKSAATLLLEELDLR